MGIGLNVKRIRKSKNYTQADLCELLNKKYSQVTISYIENEERKISADEIKDFAEALGVSILELLEE